MTGHELTAVDRISDFTFAALCECGHEATGPNPETARKRHDIHAQIQHARAALEQAKEGNVGA